MPDADTHPTPRQLADYGLGKLPAAEIAGLQDKAELVREVRDRGHAPPPLPDLGAPISGHDRLRPAGPQPLARRRNWLRAELRARVISASRGIKYCATGAILG